MLACIVLAAGHGPVRAADRFLKPEQAFRLEAVTSGTRVRLHWSIAPGYYLYRDRIAVGAEPPAAQAVALTLPAGERKDDPNFGPQQIFRHGLTVTVEAGAARALHVRWQGCAEGGVCYLPQRQTVVLAGAGGLAADGPRPLKRAP
ncbi:MAG: protein-disulfide reductase DsbD N-terminal domain-containing protein [Burkholderiales bacterium]|nr:protein-disulfide reductase DsbD N-terminal domain-containing protein [Burkholderiales bacterium]